MLVITSTANKQRLLPKSLIAVFHMASKQRTAKKHSLSVEEVLQKFLAVFHFSRLLSGHQTTLSKHCKTFLQSNARAQATQSIQVLVKLRETDRRRACAPKSAVQKEVTLHYRVRTLQAIQQVSAWNEKLSTWSCRILSWLLCRLFFNIKWAFFKLCRPTRPLSQAEPSPSDGQHACSAFRLLALD